MPEYVSSTTNMIAGALIGITFMATIVACFCAVLLNRRRKEGATDALAVARPAGQREPAKTKTERTPKNRGESAVNAKVAKAAKAGDTGLVNGARAEVIHGNLEPRVAPFSLFTRKNKTAEGRAPQIAVEERPKTLELTKSNHPEPAVPMMDKQPEIPKLKSVEKLKPEETISQRLVFQEEKGHKPGLPERKETDTAQKPKSKEASEITEPSASKADAPKGLFAPAAAQAFVTQPESAPAAPSSPQQVSPAVQSPESDASTTQLSAARTASDEAKPEDKKEQTTDSIFNLFNDTVGEESEISKFASRFDNVSLDSLLGDGQSLLKHINN